MLLGPPGFNLLKILRDVLRHPELSKAGHLIVSLSPRFLFIIYVIYFRFILYFTVKANVYQNLIKLVFSLI